MLALLGLAVGVVVGLVLDPTIPTWLVPHLPIAVVAAMDALLGGLRARLQGVFDEKVFITSFLFNTVVAAFLVYVGDKVGVGGQMTTAIVVVLGIRIFSNVAAIRRHIFKA
jgi:small basic protein